MTGFCGWLAKEGATGQSAENLGLMSQGLSSLMVQEHTESSEFCSILCKQSSADRCLAADEDIVVAIDGRIDWNNEEDSIFARKRGVAYALVSAYKQFGHDFLKRISGEFSLAIVEPQRQKLLLAVDRLGSKPLAFTHQNNFGVVFGSTVESIRLHPAIDARIDPQALFNYIYFHHIPSPQTVYKNFFKLCPGEFLVVSSGHIATKSYWNPKFNETNTDSSNDLESDLRDSLRNAVDRRLNTSNPAAFLSGGLDSSTIAGIASELRPGKFKVYTMGFEAAGYDEMHYARLAAKHFNLDLHEYYVTQQNIVDSMPIMADEYDEPFGNSSAIPTLMCARFAREDGIDCILAGDGGDELFGGNERYAKQGIYEAYRSIPKLLRSKVIEPATGMFPDIFPFGKVKSYVAQSRISMPGRLETYNLLNRNSLEKIFEPDFLGQIDTGMPLQLLTERYQTADANSLVNRMIWLDWKFTLADNDLRKVTRSCEIGGLNAAFPFLDQRLIDLSLRIPSNEKIRGRTLRYLYKNAFGNFLPKEIINKQKHGFGLPFGVWLATSKTIQDFLYPQIEALGQRGIFKPLFLKELIQANRTEHAAFYGNFVYVFGMLELWLQAHKMEL